jgi:predicted acetyltransferase
VLEVRQLDETDLDAAWRLGGLAFGSPLSGSSPRPRPSPDDPLVRWGGFDAAGRLVAKASDIHHEQWWGGRVVPASGVAGVAVEPEQRGRGATREVMTALLRHARERGAAVATLFCTSTAVYRALGFEACGVVRWVDIPTALLDRTGVPESIRLRPGDGSDWSAVRGVYDEIGRTSNGLLTRRGKPFTDPAGVELPEGIDGVTLAEDAGSGQVVGYATWQRGRGYDDDSVVTVLDCLALTGEAAAALIAVLGGWMTVAPTTRFRLPPWADAVTVRLPLERAREHHVDVWMHRPLDVVAAVSARGWPAVATGSVDFRLVDPLLPWNDGPRRLTVEAGEARLEPATHDPAAVLSVRGWSLLWSGAARAAQLRQAGLLDGGDTVIDAGLDGLLGGGGQSGLLDYF